MDGSSSEYKAVSSGVLEHSLGSLFSDPVDDWGYHETVCAFNWDGSDQLRGIIPIAEQLYRKHDEMLIETVVNSRIPRYACQFLTYFIANLLLPSIGVPEFQKQSRDENFVCALHIVDSCCDSPNFSISLIEGVLIDLLFSVGKLCSEDCGKLSVSILSKIAASSGDRLRALEDRGFSTVFMQIIRSPKSFGSRICAIIGLAPLFRITGIEKHQRQLYENLVQVNYASRNYEIEAALLYVSLDFIQISNKAASIAVQNGLIDTCMHGLSAFNQGFGDISLQDLASQILSFLWFYRPQYRELVSLERLAKQVWSLFSHERDVGNFIAGVRGLELLISDDGLKFVKKHELIQLMCRKMENFAMGVRQEVMKVCLAIMRDGDDEIRNIFGANNGFRYVLEYFDALSDEMIRELLTAMGNVKKQILDFVCREEIVEAVSAIRDDFCGEILELVDWFLSLFECSELW
jgi:hypothetical protein